jgi:perosamine synthetase
MTYISTAMAFYEAGFNVKLADVDSTTLMLTRDSVVPQLSSRTRAVVAVHLYGQRAHLADLSALCTDVGAVLVEDRAHRIAMDDPPTGDFACYSFNVLKEAPAGDGGLLWYRHSSCDAEARSMSNVGLVSDTWERTRTPMHGAYVFGGGRGLKLRLNDLAAACVLSAFESMPEWEQRRRTICLAYESHCRSLPGQIRMRPFVAGDSCLMAILRTGVGAREHVRDVLHRAGVATSVHYPALSEHPLFDATPCPRAEAAARDVVSLPLYPDLSDEAVETVLNALTLAAESLTTAYVAGRDDRA